MNNCQHANLLGAYHDGELPAESRAALERHLAQCPACSAELEQLRRVSGMFGSLPEPELSPSALEAMHESVERASSLSLCRFAEVMAAAAAVVLMVCVLGMSRQSAAPAVAQTPVWESQAIAQPADVATSAPEEMVANWPADDTAVRAPRD